MESQTSRSRICPELPSHGRGRGIKTLIAHTNMQVRAYVEGLKPRTPLDIGAEMAREILRPKLARRAVAGLSAGLITPVPALLATEKNRHLTGGARGWSLADPPASVLGPCG